MNTLIIAAMLGTHSVGQTFGDVDLSKKFCLSLGGEFSDIYFHSFKEDRFGGRLKAGWFPVNWFRFGIETAYVVADREYYPPLGGELETHQEEIHVGPVVAFYYPTNFWIRPFIEVSIGYVRGEFVQEQSIVGRKYTQHEKEEIKDDSLYWRTGMGVSMFPTRWASIDLQAAFGQVTWSPDVGGTEDRFGVQAGISLYF